MVLMVVLSSCENTTTHNERSAATKLKIAQMKLARDPHTYAKPEEARVTHLDWEAEVDFDNKIITAIARYNIETNDSAQKIILDAKGLEITAVMSAGKNLSFDLGEERKYIGSPLTIAIDSSIKTIEIHYKTPPNAEALLWVEGDHPFLFTQ